LGWWTIVTLPFIAFGNVHGNGVPILIGAIGLFTGLIWLLGTVVLLLQKLLVSTKVLKVQAPVIGAEIVALYAFVAAS